MKAMKKKAVRALPKGGAANALAESNLTCISSNPSHRHGEGNEGNEGDEEEGGHEGHEGDEEEVCEQDRNWHLLQGDGASWKQGEDRWWLDGQGPVQEQERQGREQEEVCLWQEVPMDPGRHEGTQGPEDHWLRRHQEGYTAVCQGEG